MSSKKVLYEYLVYKGEFIKREHSILTTSKKGADITYIYKDKYNNQHFVWNSDLELIRAGHIYSFADNEDRYRRVLAKYYEEKIEKIQSELKKNISYLNALETSGKLMPVVEFS